MVTDESPMKYLFRPDEIEILICGSKVNFLIFEINFLFDSLNFSFIYFLHFFVNSCFRISTSKNYKNQLVTMADTILQLQSSSIFGNLPTLYHTKIKENYYNLPLEVIEYQ